jgi:hypothetical protein
MEEEIKVDEDEVLMTASPVEAVSSDAKRSPAAFNCSSNAFAEDDSVGGVGSGGGDGDGDG